MPNAAPEAATRRFHSAVERLTGASPDDRFGIAVSGGPDSMALLLLAAAAFPGRVEAATVDHGLRPESASEADMVASWCRDRSILHATLAPPRPIAGNIQSAARVARYALLEDWRRERGLAWLMTAHHADDQRETLLMRLNRGSGVSGLAGVRRRSSVVLRPLLEWRKAELEALAVQADVPFVRDPSNSDDRFDRAALRARLDQVDWIDPLASVRSADALAEAEDALRWIAADLAARHIEREQEALVLTRTVLPRELLRRLVIAMLAQADGDAPAPRGDTLDDAIARAQAGGQASIGHWLLSGGPRWTLRRAPPRRATASQGGID